MRFIHKAKTKGNEVSFSHNNSKAADELATIREALANLGSVAGDQAKIAGQQAQVYANEGLEWAQPRVRQLLDEAQSAKADLEKQAGRKGKKVSRKARKKAEIARKEADKRRKEARKVAAQGRRKVEGDYIPRVQRAWNNAGELAQRDLPLSLKAQAIGQAAQHALTEPTPKKRARTGGKIAGWSLLGLLTAAAGYLVWTRTQPTEDPWAEEYWDDASTPTAPATTEANVKNEDTQAPATQSGTTGTTPGAPVNDADDAAKDAIVTEQRIGDTTAGDSADERRIGDVSGDEGRKLGEL